MTQIFLTFTLLLSGVVVASTSLSKEQEIERVESIAKQIRRSYWKSGHEYVSTKVSSISKTELDYLIDEDRFSSEKLNNEEIKKLRRCIQAASSCSLFTIDLWASYMGGDGKNRIWILLSPSTGKYSKLDKLIYAE